MSKHRVAVLKVVSGHLSVTAAAAECHLSRGHLHRLLRRYREAGLDGLEPRSRRPHTSPHAVPDALRDRVVALRTGLTARGLDAGPATIAWHLAREGLPVPAVSTIRRILHAAGLVVPEPHKRPRSSWIRFEAAAPNGAWQSDFTHWRLADGRGVEIISWLDDHSRYLLGCTVFRRVGGDDVVATFTAAGDEHGWPAATLTDNGTVFTARLVGGRKRPRAPPRVPRHPPEERLAGPSPDPGQDRALPPDPGSAGSGSSRRRATSRRSRASSTPSARSTTSSGRTGRSGGGPRARRTGRSPRTSRRGPPAGDTSGSATTPRTARAP